MPTNDVIRAKLRDLPHKPGVYLMKDRFGRVIYVGKARSLRKRVSQYFQPSRRMAWDLKLRAMLDAIHDLDVHIVKSEPEALLLEGKLIKEFHPRYNISFRDDKRFIMLKVNLNDPIPRFTLTRLRQDDGCLYFGPFANSGSMRRTLALARQKFNLRGCRPLTPNEHDYKHCLYAHIKVCTAPCIGNVTQEEYLAQVQAACDFLSGQSDEIRGQIETEMAKAAERLDFEKAAEYRDMLRDLKNTTRKTQSFARVPYKLPLAIDPERDLQTLAEVLDLPAVPERIEGFDISNISGTFMVSSMVAFRNGRPDRSNYRRFKMKSVTSQNDFACMAESVRRRYSRLLKEREKPGALGMPGLIVIDGGKGQLGAACIELAKLGLSDLPIIGLAKEFEEIYRPHVAEPFRLDHNNGALKLLQRVRDESHRFANTFNAQLRLKKISESLLDEFPGIGQAKKQLLLKHFGSVQRLKTASVEEISALPGFGGKSAEKLHAFLRARA